METRFTFQRVQQMRLSTFSEKERHLYQAEKTIMRQFMLMKQRDQVPAYLTVKDMKTWLLAGRSFQEEFDEIAEGTEARNLLDSELDRTTARRLCLSHMEQELLDELNEERRLSEHFSRKVTLEGIQMFVSVIRPGAEEDVETLLRSLFSQLLETFVGIQITRSPLSVGDQKPEKVLKLEHSALLLVPKIVVTALKFLLEEPVKENQTSSSSAEIGRLLAESTAPCLAEWGSPPKTLLLGVCTLAARCMVKAVCKRFDDRSKSFHQMDYDDSSFAARESVVRAIKDMEIAASSQALSQFRTPQGPGIDTSLVRVEIGVVVCSDYDIKLYGLQQEEMNDSVKEENVSFFSFIWDTMTSCFGRSNLQKTT